LKKTLEFGKKKFLKKKKNSPIIRTWDNVPWKNISFTKRYRPLIQGAYVHHKKKSCGEISHLLKILNVNRSDNVSSPNFYMSHSRNPSVIDQNLRKYIFKI